MYYRKKEKIDSEKRERKGRPKERVSVVRGRDADRLDRVLEGGGPRQ